MIDCCSLSQNSTAQNLNSTFDRSLVAKDLKRYRKYGQRKSSRVLTSLIEQHHSKGAVSLCDIGSGIGSVTHAFLKMTHTTATVVETSSAYIKASEEEATNRGIHDRITYHHGDYVYLAQALGSHDIMCLDRVICCYPDMDTLVGLSAINAKSLFAIVIPRDTIFHRMVVSALHTFHKIVNIFNPGLAPPRFYIHRLSDINATVKWCGLVPLVSKTTCFWRIAIYQRSQA